MQNGPICFYIQIHLKLSPFTSRYAGSIYWYVYYSWVIDLSSSLNETRFAYHLLVLFNRNQ